MPYKHNVSPRRTTEFNHYDGCRHRDPDNCSGCALTDLRQSSPNYSGWALVYIENHRVIPSKWRKAFAEELKSSNLAYSNNLIKTIEKHGIAFSDGNDSFLSGQILGSLPEGVVAVSLADPAELHNTIKKFVGE